VKSERYRDLTATSARLAGNSTRIPVLHPAAQPLRPTATLLRPHPSLGRGTRGFRLPPPSRRRRSGGGQQLGQPQLRRSPVLPLWPVFGRHDYQSAS